MKTLSILIAAFILFGTSAPTRNMKTVIPSPDVVDSATRLKRFADSQFISNSNKMLELKLYTLEIKTLTLKHSK